MARRVGKDGGSMHCNHLHGVATTYLGGYYVVRSKRDSLRDERRQVGGRGAHCCHDSVLTATEYFALAHKVPVTPPALSTLCAEGAAGVRRGGITPYSMEGAAEEEWQ